MLSSRENTRIAPSTPPEQGGGSKNKFPGLKLEQQKGPGVEDDTRASNKFRQRPTLPHAKCSTIGAGGLNFRVRDGNG